MANPFVEIVSVVLLFSLVFGMSATVEVSHMRKQLHNVSALLIGMSLQFLILPFVGFVAVKLFSLPMEVGITLMVITSSPGGSYSNWWCSMFNADLALSVTMTALSTLLSTIMLPANLILYTRWTYSAAVVQSLDWMALFVSLAVVIGGISAGLTASAWAKSTGKKGDLRRRANAMGNCAGLALILLSVTVSSSDHQAALWDQSPSFYAACAIPPVVGLVLAVSFATYFQLEKPERVAVSVESCYQNTGISTTVALTMFQTEKQLATAIGVPLYYGIIEAMTIFTFCLICWKSGWTKAPASENLFKMLTTSYEVEDTSPGPINEAIEVVLSPQHVCEDQNDLIFSQTNDGVYLVDGTTLEEVSKGRCKKAIDKSCKGLDMEDPTEYSVDSDGDEYDDVHEASMRHSRRSTARRLYGILGKSSSTTTELSPPTSSAHEEIPNLESAPPNAPPRFGRTLSGIRARVTGYRPQVSLKESDDERDHDLHNPTQEETQIATVQSPEGSFDDEIPRSYKAQATKSAVARVATSAANRIRPDYATIKATSPTCTILNRMGNLRTADVAASAGVCTIEDKVGQGALSMTGQNKSNYATLHSSAPLKENALAFSFDPMQGGEIPAGLDDDGTILN